MSGDVKTNGKNIFLHPILSSSPHQPKKKKTRLPYIFHHFFLSKNYKTEDI